MFLGSTHQYRQLYFCLIKLKVDEKYYSGCLTAGLLEILKIKPAQPPSWDWGLNTTWTAKMLKKNTYFIFEGRPDKKMIKSLIIGKCNPLNCVVFVIKHT